MNTVTAPVRPPEVKPVPVLGRRFEVPDLSTHGQWIIDRLIKAFPNRNQRDLVGWLKEICWSNEYFFRCRPHAVALAHLQRPHPLAPKNHVKVIFAFAQKGFENEGAAFYDEIMQWAKSLDVDVVELTDLSDVPGEMLKDRFRAFSKTVNFARAA